MHSFQHNRIVKGVAFSQDSSFLVTGSTEKLIRVFDINKPEASKCDSNKPQVKSKKYLECTNSSISSYSGPAFISGHTGAIKDVAFLGEDTIASISQDQTLRLWDRRTGAQTQQVLLRAIPNSMEICKDGSIVTVSHGCSVSFWKIKNG